ncbi:MAG: pyruvate dehydrogenase (acetyl-transferring) E1 component subunit alpha [Chloroflexi bacterium]|nr:pyruvate dehydrogenase (acetyl-transferring) E1 component subunit alpha [Chloroflexota bacterium]|tara:strand:+ start:1466 stop:2500 length:1035 start_codon:yes stop_codon:yes gene_type:complete
MKKNKSENEKKSVSISPKKLRWLYSSMYRIRRFEETMLEQTFKGNAMGVTHPSDGQEAGPVGICAHLTDKDWIGSTHRGHGHCIAKGLETNRMMAEIMGRSTGQCHGKGGSMHIADFSKGMLGANAIVGASIPLAVGAALTSKYKNNEKKSVAVAFFGDGATSQGVLHESMNLSSIWKLPVIFACENNGYAEATPSWYAVSTDDIASRAEGYGIPGLQVDGMDVFSVYDAAEQAVKRARSGEGPTFLEIKTYRYHGHFHADDPKKYRKQEEEDYFKSKDCLISFEERVTESGLMTSEDLNEIRNEIEEEIKKATDFALTSPMPDHDELYKDVYVEYSNSLLGLR